MAPESRKREVTLSIGLALLCPKTVHQKAEGMKSPQELKREAEIRRNLVQQIKEELATLVRRVPPGFQSWSHQKTVGFKAAMLEAHKVIGNPGASYAQAQVALMALRPFHKHEHPWSKLEADKCD